METLCGINLDLSKKLFKLIYIFEKSEYISIKIKEPYYTLIIHMCYICSCLPYTTPDGLIGADCLPLEYMTGNKCPFLFPRRLLTVGHQGGPPA